MAILKSPLLPFCEPRSIHSFECHGGSSTNLFGEKSNAFDSSPFGGVAPSVKLLKVSLVAEAKRSEVFNIAGGIPHFLKCNCMIPLDILGFGCPGVQFSNAVMYSSILLRRSEHSSIFLVIAAIHC